MSNYGAAAWRQFFLTWMGKSGVMLVDIIKRYEFGWQRKQLPWDLELQDIARLTGSRDASDCKFPRSKAGQKRSQTLL
jgi:hypothetical protein